MNPYLEDILDVWPRVRVAPRHEGRPVPSPILSSRNSRTHKQEALSLQRLGPSLGVLVLGVTPVDDDVTFLHQRHQLLDEVVHGLARCNVKQQCLDVVL